MVGLALTRALADAGVKIVLNGRGEAKLNAAARVPKTASAAHDRAKGR